MVIAYNPTENMIKMFSYKTLLRILNLNGYEVEQTKTTVILKKNNKNILVVNCNAIEDILIKEKNVTYELYILMYNKYSKSKRYQDKAEPIKTRIKLLVYIRAVHNLCQELAKTESLFKTINQFNP